MDALPSQARWPRERGAARALGDIGDKRFAEWR
jgi:hypothetical protein